MVWSVHKGRHVFTTHPDSISLGHRPVGLPSRHPLDPEVQRIGQRLSRTLSTPHLPCKPPYFLVPSTVVTWNFRLHLLLGYLSRDVRSILRNQRELEKMAEGTWAQ